MSSLIWAEVLAQLEKSVSRPNFVTWLKPASFIESKDGLVIIGVPNHYAKSWIEQNAVKDIIKYLSEHLGSVESVKIEVVSDEGSKSLDDLPLLQSEAESIPVASPAEELVEEEPVNDFSNSFRDKYTFETFIVGNNNRLAFAASQAVAEKPGFAYNPLFIYGGVGLGKTHLMHAIGNDISRKNPKKKIIYTSCEIFTSEFIQALQTKNINSFKNKYRQADVFLIDDIQFLANKEGTQEEFFHTFNMLHQANKQIVITSDRVPKEMNNLEERLISRFGWGMIADVQSPNFENRVAILQEKSKERDAEVSSEVCEFIATTITSNVRELEGSLTKLITAAQIEKAEITTAFAARVLKDLLSTSAPNVTTKKVIQAVAQYFSIETSDLLGKKRIKELVYPRQLVMYFLREKLSQSFPQIGDALGGKDHTTVMHGVKKIVALKKISPEVEQDINAIQQLFN
jgi:chromosomal replication initiator protein